LKYNSIENSAAENATPQKAVLFTTGSGRTIEISGLCHWIFFHACACALQLVDALNNHIEFLHPNIHTIATAAAMSWAESFGSTPESDDDEGIDVELAVNLAIASRKRFTWQISMNCCPGLMIFAGSAHDRTYLGWIEIGTAWHKLRTGTLWWNHLRLLELWAT